MSVPEAPQRMRGGVMTAWEYAQREFAELPTLAKNILVRNGHFTRRSVASTPDQQLIEYLGMGRRSLEAIRELIPYDSSATNEDARLLEVDGFRLVRVTEIRPSAAVPHPVWINPFFVIGIWGIEDPEDGQGCSLEVFGVNWDLRVSERADDLAQWLGEATGVLR